MIAQLLKNSCAMEDTLIWSLGWEDPLEEGMATHSSILAWRTPWTEEPGGLQSLASDTAEHTRRARAGGWPMGKSWIWSHGIWWNWWGCESAAPNMPANLENSAVTTGLEKVSFHSNPKERNAKECSNNCTIALISHASKVMLKILQARLQQYVNCEIPDDQAGFRKGRGTRDQIANIRWIMEKTREFQKNISFCFID